MFYVHFVKNMSLQQQIEREMQQEAKIDKTINNVVKRLFKLPDYKKYRIINDRKNSDAILVFNRYDLTTYNILLNDNKSKNLDEAIRISNNNNAKIFYLKNKNPHDSKNSTLGQIKKVCN